MFPTRWMPFTWRNTFVVNWLRRKSAGSSAYGRIASMFSCVKSPVIAKTITLIAIKANVATAVR